MVHPMNGLEVGRPDSGFERPQELIAADWNGQSKRSQRANESNSVVSEFSNTLPALDHNPGRRPRAQDGPRIYYHMPLAHLKRNLDRHQSTSTRQRRPTFPTWNQPRPRIVPNSPQPNPCHLPPGRNAPKSPRAPEGPKTAPSQADPEDPSSRAAESSRQLPDASLISDRSR